MSCSFKKLDEQAKAGESINVVFLGGSLTWGANASDPNVYSYRALMGLYLQNRYSKARVNCYDAAIGGTGSDLGMFRLERDVLSHDPDLVFVEYTVNDNCWEDNEDVLYYYETILRELISRGIAVEQVLLGIQQSYALTRFDKATQKVVPVTLEDGKRRVQHLKLSAAYGTAVADTYPVLREKAANGEIDLDSMYCFENTHPDNIGYRKFFEVVRDAFEVAVDHDVVCRLPEKCVYGCYTRRRRLCLRDTQLPDGWIVQKTFRHAAWFDGMASRWMEDVAVFDIEKSREPVVLKIEFEGSMVGVFGESGPDGINFRFLIDGVNPDKDAEDSDADKGKLCVYNAMKDFGKLFVWRPLAVDLEPGKHTLEIIPVIPEDAETGQLRIESVCFAG